MQLEILRLRDFEHFAWPIHMSTPTLNGKYANKQLGLSLLTKHTHCRIARDMQHL